MLKERAIVIVELLLDYFWIILPFSFHDFNYKRLYTILTISCALAVYVLPRYKEKKLVTNICICTHFFLADNERYL